MRKWIDALKQGKSGSVRPKCMAYFGNMFHALNSSSTVKRRVFQLRVVPEPIPEFTYGVVHDISCDAFVSSKYCMIVRINGLRVISEHNGEVAMTCIDRFMTLSENTENDRSEEEEEAELARQRLEASQLSDHTYMRIGSCWLVL